MVPLIVGVTSATGEGGGVAAPLSVIIASVGVFAIGWLVARYAREVHAAGGLYDYVSRGLGERPGVATGILYYAGILVLSVGLIVLIGGYVHDTIAREFGFTAVPQWCWSGLTILAIVAVLYFGVRLSTRVQLVLALLSFLAVVAFFVFVIVKLGHANTATPFNPSSSHQGWPGILFGVLYGVLLFVGFETAANLGEETKEPHRAIPTAVLATAVIACAFFVLAAYTQVVGFHLSLLNLTNAANSASGSPLIALGAPGPAGFGGTWIGRGLELVVLLDMLAVALGTGVASTRGLFALARDRRIPPVLAKVSSFGTPVAAIALLGVVAAANVVVTQNWARLFAMPPAPHYFAIFVWDSTFGGFALVCVYLLLCFGAIVSFWSRPGKVLALLAAGAGIAVTAGAIFGSFDKVPKPTLYAPIAGLGVLAVGFAVAYLTKGRAPASLHIEDLAVNPELARLEPLQVTAVQAPVPVPDVEAPPPGPTAVAEAVEIAGPPAVDAEPAPEPVPSAPPLAPEPPTPAPPLDVEVAAPDAPEPPTPAPPADVVVAVPAAPRAEPGAETPVATDAPGVEETVPPDPTAPDAS